MPAEILQETSVTHNKATWQTQAARARADTYRLLARLLYRAPDSDLLHRLAQLDLSRDEVSESDSAEPELTRAWRRLRKAAETTDPAAADDVFHALFIGLGRGEVLPYASWYLAGALMDRPLVALRSDLARLGIVRDEDNREPEDHAAALFETMALLADPIEGVAVAEQRHFLLMHVTPWSGRLFTDITNAASVDDFYCAVAALGSAFIAVEQSWLSLPT